MQCMHGDWATAQGLPVAPGYNLQSYQRTGPWRVTGAGPGPVVDLTIRSPNSLVLTLVGMVAALQVLLSHRLGMANVFDPVRPSMHYKLRMWRADDHQVLHTALHWNSLRPQCIAESARYVVVTHQGALPKVMICTVLGGL